MNLVFLVSIGCLSFNLGLFHLDLYGSPHIRAVTCFDFHCHLVVAWVPQE